MKAGLKGYYSQNAALGHVTKKQLAPFYPASRLVKPSPQQNWLIDHIHNKLVKKRRGIRFLSQ
jgi:hypothetical protein